MKSEHRHELKTNELAEWLSNFPEWLKENSKIIIGITALVVIVVGFYGWRRYDKNVLQVRERNAFSGLLDETTSVKIQVAVRQAQGTDNSHYLIPLATNLGSFAENTKKKNMAALALIKEAETLRAELHYRLSEVSKEDFTGQINRAKACYTEAIARASFNPRIIVAAKFGLGLCAEELGDFEQAMQIYKEIVANDSFQGTVFIVQAKNRLDYISDYQKEIVFKPAPKKEPAVATEPPVQVKPVDVNMPVEASFPVDVNFTVKIPEVNSQIHDMNFTSIASDELSEDSDVNVPIE